MKALASLVFTIVLTAVIGCQTSSKPAESTAVPAASAAPVAAPAPAPKPQLAYATFGAAPTLAPDAAIPVEKVMANPDEYKGKLVRLTGTVEKVCSRKGCWLTLKSPEGMPSLFVKFPDPEQGRLIPMDAVGKPAIVEGTVRVKEIPEEIAKHYAEESGATKEELAKIVGSQKQITVASPSAQVAGVQSGQDQPAKQ